MYIYIYNILIYNDISGIAVICTKRRKYIDTSMNYSTICQARTMFNIRISLVLRFRKPQSPKRQAVYEDARRDTLGLARYHLVNEDILEVLCINEVLGLH